ncbi:hypothetical protein [Methylocaldum sp. SAD2]|jgi:Fe(3+) dicitrate transport protein|uniref:hypothetical protein n=1 Tax=Methylocaldum sp. GT1TLB TaxID=3438965 RepID=UPI000A323190
MADQFSDVHNAEGQVNPDGTPSPSGQFGKIEDCAIAKLAATYRIKPLNTDVFVSVKNLFDQNYIVDRTRGISPGSPRLVQAGFKLDFRAFPDRS